MKNENDETGTISDPYRCTTADGFDDLMRSLYSTNPSGLQINLGSGTFLTRGRQYSYQVNGSTFTFGWQMGNKWALRGAGINATTIKLDQWPIEIVNGNPQALHGGHAVVGARNIVDNSGSSVRDLTVDANWGGGPTADPPSDPTPPGRPTDNSRWLPPNTPEKNWSQHSCPNWRFLRWV